MCREEVTSKKLEGTLVKQITELNLVAEAEQVFIHLFLCLC